VLMIAFLSIVNSSDKVCLIKWPTILPQVMYFLLSSPILQSSDLDISMREGSPLVSSYDMLAYGAANIGYFARERVFPSDIAISEPEILFVDVYSEYVLLQFNASLLIFLYFRPSTPPEDSHKR
jgi:hypothetical protein